VVNIAPNFRSGRYARLLSRTFAAVAVLLAAYVGGKGAAVRPAPLVFEPENLTVTGNIVMPVGKGVAGRVTLRRGYRYDIALQCSCWTDLEKNVNPGIRVYIRFISAERAHNPMMVCLDPYRRPADRGPLLFTQTYLPNWAGEAEWRISTEYLVGTPVPAAGNFLVASLTLRERTRLTPLLWAGAFVGLAGLAEAAARRGRLSRLPRLSWRRAGAWAGYVVFLIALFPAVFEVYFRLWPERLPLQVLNSFPDKGYHLLKGTKDLIYNPRTQYAYRPHRQITRKVAGQYGPLQTTAGAPMMLLFRDEDLPEIPGEKQPLSYVHDVYGFRTPSGIGESSIVTLSSSFFVTPGVPDGATFAGRLETLTGVRVYNVAQGGWPPGALLNALDDALARADRPMTVVYGGILNHFRRASVEHLKLSDSWSWQPGEVSVFFDIAGKPPPDLLFGLLATTVPSHWRNYTGLVKPPRKQLNTWAGGDIAQFFQDREMATTRRYTWAGRTAPLYFFDERVSTYFNDPLDPEAVQLWLDKLADVVSRHNGRLLLVQIPYKYAVLARLLGDQITRDDLTVWLGVKEQALPADIPPWEVLERIQAELMEHIRAEAARHDFGVIDLLPVLQRHAAAGGLPFYRFDTHWNQEGIDLSARETADWLEHHGWLDMGQEPF